MAKVNKRKCGAAVGSSDLVRRFTDKQAELAAKLSNDIAEDTDCGESRKTLRMAVAYFADVACVESRRRAAAESKLEISRCAKSLMDAALPPNDPSSATASAARVERTVRSRTPAMLERTAQRPFAAAHG